MFTRLEIVSDNPDWAGYWTRYETEQAMQEVGITPANDIGWMMWLLDHSFDSSLPSEFEKIILDDKLSEIKFTLADNNVHIMKF